ncbi:DNA repair protein RecN (Recombination protein N) [Trueperella bonasi]|uniref:DNA repair protein RecN n=1 Tax=Trueperella bonasi TaxID=312286 RepID=A0ABT9NDV1_9ACTO|nr:DNA repair protein RecN [Trueperella bonasi]MDP9805567.1 DNA repair protein RecN (Recombination protein N) [Trueperella bonasi]
MIEELRISNLGVIESAELNLCAGMTAITGETGAGKTMALTSLSLLMGQKADPARVRSGAERAIVEGTFVVQADSPVVDIVENAGGTVDNDGDMAAIIIARHVPAKGRSRAFVGGQSVPISVLSDIAEHVVTVHGQSDQIKLRSERMQRAALDSFGGVSIAEASQNYRKAWEGLRSATNELEKFQADMKQAASERLALEALVKRVDAVEPERGEEDELKARAMQLENVEDLRAAMAGAISSLEGFENESGALASLDSASQLLLQVSDADFDLADLGRQLKDAAVIASDVSNVLGIKLGELNADPEELNRIHERRAELRQIQRDLGMTIEEILETRQLADSRLASLASPDEHLEDLENAVARAREELEESALILTERRRAAADELSEQVTRELHSLAMKDATFSVSLTRANEALAHGMDEVAFLLSPHRGASKLPLATSASGGEMSRIMLAIETALNAKPRPDHTFIFDEVDAGIGGKTALSVGERLARVAKSAQVLTVTHLAQVAAYAGEHVVVAKKSDGDTTSTDVRVVAGDARVSELARMLSGHEESQAARTHAAELIRTAIVP